MSNELDCRIVEQLLSSGRIVCELFPPRKWPKKEEMFTGEIQLRHVDLLGRNKKIDKSLYEFTSKSLLRNMCQCLLDQPNHVAT